MNPIVLYLFFTFDNFRACADVFLFLMSVAFIVGLLVFCIGFMAIRYETYTYDDVRIPRANEWCSRFKRVRCGSGGPVSWYPYFACPWLSWWRSPKR